jgi:hypothetical protein
MTCFRLDREKWPMHFELLEPPYTTYPLASYGFPKIGRETTCEVFLPRPDVAKVHARLRTREGYWLLCTHVNEGYRTLLNGKAPSVPFPVIDGDLLTIGDVVLRFVSET